MVVRAEPELRARTATILVLCYVLFFPVDMFFLSRAWLLELADPPLYAALISSVHLLLFIYWSGFTAPGRTATPTFW